MAAVAAGAAVMNLSGAAVQKEDKIDWLATGPVRQNCFTHCPVDFNPGEKYATRKREWQGCPTILRTPKGTLYAGWYSGGPGEGLLNYSLMVKSTDGGLSWSKEPLLVIDSLTDKKIQSLDIQYWLDPDGRFWYFWTQRDYNYPMRHPKHLSVWAMICDDPDAETLRWSKPFFVSPGFLRCQPTVLKDGRWILCAYDWVDEYYRYSESFDKGRTWYRRKAGKKYPGRTFDESMVFEQKDGTLRLLARCAKKTGFLIECFSRDGGKTWSDGKLSNIPNPSCRFFIKRLASGKVLLINNFDSNDRYQLGVALSEDDGKTWKHQMILDPRRCSYPDAVQAPGGEIFIVHDFSRGTFKEIMISRLTEQDIIVGLKKYALINADSFLKHIINKAPEKADLTPAEKALSDKFRPPVPLSPPRPLFEIDGRVSKATLSNITVDSKKLRVTHWDNSPGINVSGLQNLGKEWQSFSISFVSDKPGLVFSFRVSGNNFVDYDDIKVVNGTIYNPSFELINKANEADGWRYYAPQVIKTGKADAADGKNYITCTSKIAARQGLTVIPGKVVTITFKARAGQKFEMPKKAWSSSGRRQL